jgi:hypothetical protein
MDTEGGGRGQFQDTIPKLAQSLSLEKPGPQSSGTQPRFRYLQDTKIKVFSSEQSASVERNWKQYDKGKCLT